MKQVEVFDGARKLAIRAAGLLLLLLLIPSFAYAASDMDYTVKVDKGSLALRSEAANDDGNVIGELRSGDTVEVRKKSSGEYWWVYAPTCGENGYVEKDYLVSTATYGDYQVRVEKNYLALRTAPAFDCENEIGQLRPGDLVTVKKKPEGDYWWVYSPRCNKSGYVNKDYLKAMSSTYGNYTVKVGKKYLALRNAAANDEDNVIGELHDGDVVTVEKKGGRYWWVYSLNHNKEGYVNKDFLEKE